MQCANQRITDQNQPALAEPLRNVQFHLPLSPELQRFDALRGAYFPDAQLLSAQRLTQGLIHESYVLLYRTASGKPAAYVAQRLNAKVFPDLPLLNQNLKTVSEHLQRRCRSSRDRSFVPLEIVPTQSGESSVAVAGDCWRLLKFINGQARNTCTSEREAWEASRACGRLAALLANLDPARVPPVLPGFHDTAARYQQLWHAEQQAWRFLPERWAKAQGELSALRGLEQHADLITTGLRRGSIPVRLCSNDTKFNNILFDPQGLRAISVVDLDTVMPGALAYDFGDLVRTIVPSTSEEGPAAQVAVRPSFLLGVVAGYVRGLADYWPAASGLKLKQAEIVSLSGGALVVPLNMAVRFLTGYLTGDPYHRVDPARPDHNLERACNQRVLAEALVRQHDVIADAVRQQWRMVSGR